MVRIKIIADCGPDSHGFEVGSIHEAVTEVIAFVPDIRGIAIYQGEFEIVPNDEDMDNDDSL